MRTRQIIALLALCVLVACGDDSDGAGDSSNGGESTARADGTADGPALQVASTELGPVIADGDGHVVYVFLPDQQGESTCYDECESNWPPVSAVTSVGGALDGTLLGTTTRTGGAVQATYGDWPLYYFAGDTTPGNTNGQGLNDVWYVLDASGSPARPVAGGVDY